MGGLFGGGKGGGSAARELTQEEKQKKLEEEHAAKQNAPYTPPPGYVAIPAEQLAYSQAFRPGYREFGPSGQFQQPIYQSSYEGYAAPTGLYSPSYGIDNLYNPYATYIAQQAQQAAQQFGQGDTQTSTANKARGGAIESQGIDTLLK
jgi:hypothetical protein